MFLSEHSKCFVLPLEGGGLEKGRGMDSSGGGQNRIYNSISIKERGKRILRIFNFKLHLEVVLYQEM